MPVRNLSVVFLLFAAIFCSAQSTPVVFRSSQRNSQLRCDRDRQDRRSLRGLLPVRLRQLDEEQSHSARQVALGTLRRAVREQSLHPARHSRPGPGSRPAQRQPRRWSATSTPPAWMKAPSRRREPRPWLPELERISAVKTKADLIPQIAYMHQQCHAGAVCLLLAARHARLERDHRLPRPGWTHAARPRLLHQGRCQVGGDPPEISGARAEDVRAGGRQARRRRQPKPRPCWRSRPAWPRPRWIAPPAAIPRRATTR